MTPVRLIKSGLRRGSRYLSAALLTIGLLSGFHSMAQSGYELDSLLTASNPPARFSAHTPNFSYVQTTRTFQAPTGSRTIPVVLIKDGTKVIAVYFPDNQYSVVGSYIELLSNDPTKGVAETSIPWSKRNDFGLTLGTRLSTTAWYPAWDITGTWSYQWSGSGSSLTLTETQEWASVRRYSRHVFTLRFDAKLGYYIDASLLYESNLSTEAGKKVTLINLMDSRFSNPWPGKSEYQNKVFSKPGITGFSGWAMNLRAADDTTSKNLPVREGGFDGFFKDVNGWGVALFRKGGYSFDLAPCNVWLDMHNRILLPSTPAADGYYRVSPSFRLAFLPPETANHVLANTTYNTFNSAEQVMIKVGAVEDFETQRVRLSTTSRGLWASSLNTVNTTIFRSGSKSLAVPAVTQATADGKYYNFFTAPQIPLEANASYRLESWIRLEGSGESFIQGNLYEENPHHDARLRIQATTKALAGQGWKYVSLDFTTPAYEVFIDVRFKAIGTGTAYFDDFCLKKMTVSNNAPTVSLTSPANGATYSAPANVAMSSSATDSDGSVSKVEFFNGTALLSTDTSSPYAGTWSGVSAGTYNLTAKATDNGAASTTSAVVKVIVNGTAAGTTSYKINAGGGAVSPFTADANFSGGTTASTTATINLTGVTSPAPAAVYQTERYGNCTYTFGSLTANTSHTVRLHFAETWHSGAGLRKFDVSINGTQVLNDYDVFAAAGAKNKAVITQHTVNANASGQIVIQFTNVVDNAKISGIEIIKN